MKRYRINHFGYGILKNTSNWLAIFNFFKYKPSLNDLNDRLHRTIKGYNRENDPFFSKPHTGIESYIGSRKTVTLGRENEVHDIVDKQNFDIIIWNLRVVNKYPEIAQTAINCSALINWEFIQSEGQLLWKTPKEEPSSCNLPISPTKVQLLLLTLKLGTKEYWKMITRSN